MVKLRPFLPLIVIVCVSLGLFAAATTIPALAHFLKGWQTLIATFMAAIGVSLTWINASRQIKFSSFTREEERIERELPGLRQGHETLDLVLLRARSVDRPHDVIGALLDLIFRQKSIKEWVVERMPSADERRRLEVSDAVFAIYEAGVAFNGMNAQTAAAEQMDRINSPITTPNKSTELVRSNEIADAHAELERRVAKASEMSTDFRNRIMQLEIRRTKIRKTIDRVIDA